MIIIENAGGEGLVAAFVDQRFPHCCGAVGIVVIVALEQVREKEELEHEKENKQLDENDCPQIAAHGHLSEAVDIET